LCKEFGFTDRILYEHQQNLQMSSLTHLMARHGFGEFLRSNDDFSRNLGFVSLFKKSRTITTLLAKDTSVVEQYVIGKTKPVDYDDYSKNTLDLFLNN